MAVGVHEAAHAWTADKLGDNTARLLGRTSINPLVHLDPMGMALFFLTWFGWGKPVPVNEMRLGRRSDIILVALAGPASNLALAVVLSSVVRLTNFVAIDEMLSLFIFINLSLMIFNLLPIPPLDGSKILRLFLSDHTNHMLEQYGFILIIFLFFMIRIGDTGLSDLMSRLIQFLFSTLVGTQ